MASSVVPKGKRVKTPLSSRGEQAHWCCRRRKKKRGKRNATKAIIVWKEKEGKGKGPSSTHVECAIGKAERHIQREKREEGKNTMELRKRHVWRELYGKKTYKKVFPRLHGKKREGGKLRGSNFEGVRKPQPVESRRQGIKTFSL